MSVPKRFQDRLRDCSHSQSRALAPGVRRRSSRTLCDVGAQAAQSTPLLCLEALQQGHWRKTKRQQEHRDAILLVGSLPWQCHPSDGHLEVRTGPTFSFHIPTASRMHSRRCHDPVLSGVSTSSKPPPRCLAELLGALSSET